MSISIAMTTYNGEIYLQDQLNSFCSQTRLPDELIVCDDGSTDRTHEILASFQQKAPFRVGVYINETNIGFTQNFSKALSKCEGNHIFLSDQDDVWHPNKIEIIELEFINNPDKQLIIHDGELVDNNLASTGVTKLAQVVSGYGKEARLVTGALSVIDKELLPLVLPIPKGINGHDGWIHNIAGLLGTRKVLNQSLQVIRRHGSNTSSWVASSTKKIGRWDVLKSQSKTSISENYNDRILINKSSLERLIKSLNNGSCYREEVIRKNISILKQEYIALCRRNRLAESTYLKIRILALKMLFLGDYKYFNGYKSFIRDIIR